MLILLLIAGAQSAAAAPLVSAPSIVQATGTAPSGLASPSQELTSIKLTWNAWNNAPRYRIQFSTKPDMSGATYYRYGTTSATITGLTKNTTYYFRVRALDSDNSTALSPYSDAVKVSTKTDSLSPTGLKFTEQSEFGIKLAWNAWNNAPRYRIQFSTKPDMSGATYYRYYTTTADIRGLTPNTTYYFRVSAISADGTTSLSPYSSAITAKTTAAAPTATPAPTGLKFTEQSEFGIKLAWNAWNNAPRYRIQFSTKPDMSGATYYRYYTTTADIRGLTPNTTYYFRVSAISADGTTSLSPYSSAITAKTSPTLVLPPINNPLRVASYNVKCANCFAGDPNELPWADRRATVVSTIKAQLPDVLAVQEASQGWLKDDSRPGGISQFEDLAERLVASGAPYKLTNTKRNNCVNQATPTNCVYQYQGASQGTKLLFNGTTVDLLNEGSLALPALTGQENDRYVAWATFRQKTTGKKFLVANAHLQLGSGEEYQALRDRQTRSMLAEIKLRNPEDLPVLITGDLNSHKWTSPSNVPYDVITAAGYVDPLGNTYATDLPSSGATVEHRIGTFYDSFNAFKRLANARNDYGNGTYLDYIFTSKMRVSEWETVVNVDSAGNFIGVIPSDHNMIRVDVELP
ncbi:fibronectin type III domain-containing protein [Arthrobacter pityocampae]|uniref:fibronectin type III domain-containing protein n=1 Tax=Arthrobacter pityocampae TaxID=547334 RepID=UPI00142D7546|nr:fibronectin type III domain-containing protein [Arthrobacter pityocampae]